MFFGTNTVANNLVYDSGVGGRGVASGVPSGGRRARTNTTVMELAAKAVEVWGSGQKVQLKNNTRWAGGLGHVTLSVANTAQRGFTSDFNDLLTTAPTSFLLSQYASTVIDFSSQFSTSSFAATQALGAPNVSTYGDNASAWAPTSRNGTVEFITLGYSTPVSATGVTIRETWGNGFVTKVELLDVSDAFHTVFNGTDPSLPGTPADFDIAFAPTTYQVKAVRITTDTNHNLSTWEEIDGVQLRGIATGGAQLGFWQNTFATLADWRYELGFDTHSLSTDPRFVDVDGADGIRGFQEFGGLRFEGFANRTFTGTATMTAIDRVVSFPSIFGGFRGLPDNNQSLRWSGEVYLSAVGDYSFAINSAGPQRLFVESLSTPLIDDFTTPSNVERSGVFHNATAGRWVSLRYEAVDVGAFPSRAVLQWSTPDNPARRPIWAHETAQAGAAGVAAGLQVLRYQADPRSTGEDDDFHLASRVASYHGGAWSADAVDSPAIDAGNLADLVTEDHPTGLSGPLATQDGGRVNLGFDGNTGQASRPAAKLIQLLSPNGLEKFRANGEVIITWRSLGAGDFVDVAVSLDDGATYTTIVAAQPNDGNFAWNPRETDRTLRARVRISDSLAPSVQDASDDVFTIGASAATGNAYFVNDGSLVGDEYTTAVGDNRNSGTTPGDPVKSLRALLTAYSLKAGDTILVDTGVYTLSANVVIGTADSGVHIQGPVGAGHEAGLNRGNGTAGRYA